MEKVDVLIVDDRADGLLALESVLNLPNINLLRAQSGYEALAQLENHDVAVILLDVQMPGMDGFQTAQEIRRRPRHRQTPIIFVTAINKDDQYIHRGYEVGAVDYICKPFEPYTLKAKVAVFVDLFMKSKQLEEQARIIRESEMRERYMRLAELEVQSLRRYRSLADAVPHIIWRANVGGSFDYFNKGWTDYTGLSLEQSLGSGWQQAVYKDDLPLFLKTWMSSMNDGRGFEAEFRLINKNGDARWYWARSVSEKDFSGDVIAWIGTCTDIHYRKTMELKLIEAEKQANAASISKSNFLANMSHEIRTPMNAILGFTELVLDRNQTPQESTNWLLTVQKNGQQLLKLIDEILDISKVEAGRLQVDFVEVDMQDLLGEIHELLKVKALSKGLEFKIQLDTPIPKRIKADPMRLRQILINLIGNALKFTNQGFVRLGVKWIPENADKQSKMQFYISDSGVGISEDASKRLFESFMQEDTTTTRKYGGTGLGLALSRKLARCMDGDVSLVESVQARGSTFLLEIAGIPEGTESIDTINYAQQNRRTINRFKRDRRLNGLRVLLVEDVEDNQALISHFLKMVGIQVDFADNGQEGVEKAMSADYDAVLMDVQMPIMDGYEATRKLRAAGYSKPIIALTAHALKEEVINSRKAGCTGYITKPVDFDRLIEILAGQPRHLNAE